MRIPFRSLHLVPTHVCLDLACAPRLLDQPIVAKVPVIDTIGIEYAFDLQLTQGFYMVLASYFLFRWARDEVRKALAKRE